MTIRNIPDEVLSRFKSWASFYGMTLNEAVIKVMKEKGEQVDIKDKNQ